jgi:steroid delta-isomerase-like uncharacterized protein
MGASREVAERAYAAMAAYDVPALMALCAPACEMTEGGMSFQGPEQIGPYLQAYFTAFPDMRLNVLKMVEEGDSVVAEIRFTGTQSGPLAMPGGELPASGKQIDLRSADFVTVEDGLITSWRVYIDMAEFMRQLGLMPDPTQAVSA